MQRLPLSLRGPDAQYSPCRFGSIQYSKPMKYSIISIVRIALTASGGAVTSSGLITGSDWDAVAGAIVILVGVVWELVERRITKRKIDTARQA